MARYVFFYILGSEGEGDSDGDDPAYSDRGGEGDSENMNVYDPIATIDTAMNNTDRAK